MAKKKTTTKYKVIYDKYDRYGDGGTGRETIEAESDIDALIQIEEDHGYGSIASRIEEGEVTREDLKYDDVLYSLMSSNGDGCDFVISIINMKTGKDLLEGQV